MDLPTERPPDNPSLKAYGYYLNGTVSICSPAGRRRQDNHHHGQITRTRATQISIQVTGMTDYETQVPDAACLSLPEGADTFRYASIIGEVRARGRSHLPPSGNEPKVRRISLLQGKTMSTPEVARQAAGGRGRCSRRPAACDAQHKQDPGLLGPHCLTTMQRLTGEWRTAPASPWARGGARMR